MSCGGGGGGRANARPDRAVIHYATMCRQAYKGVRIVIGGIEASLRRLAHYDYWADKVRKSILLDSKADILVYGMGERQIVEILRRLGAGDKGATAPEAEQREAVLPTGALQTTAAPELDLAGIRGTAWARHVGSISRDALAAKFHDSLLLPDFDSLAGTDPQSKLKFQASFALQYKNTDPFSAKRLVEPYGDRVVVQEPPAFPLDREELDAVYALPYLREAHPMYQKWKGVPALAEVKFSLLSSRGCFGACSFCALTFHQGRQINSRSVEAIVGEAKLLTKLGDFKGYIHDVGGPTANFRHSACKKMETKGACLDRRCLSPEPCPNLEPDHREYVRLLRELRSLQGVKKVFVRSGVRFDYVMRDSNEIGRAHV